MEKCPKSHKPPNLGLNFFQNPKFDGKWQNYFQKSTFKNIIKYKEAINVKFPYYRGLNKKDRV